MSRFSWSIPAAVILAAALLLSMPRPLGTPDDRALVLDRASTAIVVFPRDGSAEERTAAEDLARYLGKALGGNVAFVADRDHRASEPAIHVGRTGFSRARGIDCDAYGREGWLYRNVGGHVVVCGGRPRGTLYGVYRLLEDEVGVRWWTPFDETVPSVDRLVLGPFDRDGRPAFAIRDLNGIPGRREFCVRNRLNGHFARLDDAHGGFEGYGPPRQVHNFFTYVPPERYFYKHPEFFSEIGGLRIAEGSQLCLTNPELADLVGQKLEAYVEQGREASRRQGIEAPRLYDFSQNDQGRACTCAACTEVNTREGTRAGTLIEFVNGLADRVSARYPELLIDTLAYGFSFEPPRESRTRANVVVRLAPLYGRDFSKPLGHPANAGVLRALEGWSGKTDHLRIWDYAVTFGEDGDLPLPNLSFMAENLRTYLAHGVEGVFVQQDPAVGTDLADLKLWITIKLLEEPQRDFETLLVEFTDGYYGAAGESIRAYVERLSEAAEARPATIGFASGIEAFDYLEPAFLVEAQQIFGAAEAAVLGDAELRSRVRHARLTLDRATLLRAQSSGPAVRAAFDLQRIAKRYRETWREQVLRRYPERERDEALEAIDDAVDALAARLGLEQEGARR